VNRLSAAAAATVAVGSTQSLPYLSQNRTILARKIFTSVDMHVCVYKRVLFASSEDQAKVVLQSVYHKASHFFVIFSYNGKMIDVALSFRSADKLRYQSQKKGFYISTFVRRCHLSVEIRHDKLLAGNR
jgi:uncharacterized protein YprB with RNaseH-like and TPR domain